MPPRTDPREIIFPYKTIRCVLVHDHVLLRQGLRRLLEDEADIEVVGEAGNAAEGLRKVREHQPDVLVSDTATFRLPAQEAQLLAAQESPRTKIVFLSIQEPANSSLADSRTAMAVCAVRQTSAEELVEMVRSSCRYNVASRNPTSQISALSGRDSQRSAAIPFPPERGLTAREREVMKLLAEGKTVRAAATVLGLSSKTVDAHKFNLMRKLGIHNKAELVMWAIRKKVVKIPANF